MDTGYDRSYGNNPYVGYDSADEPFLFDGETDGPLPQMARVVAAGGDADPVAYAWETLERVTHDDTFWFVQHAFRPETRVVD